MLDFALRFDPARAPGLVAQNREAFGDDAAAVGVASVLGAAYPALAGVIAAAPDIARSIRARRARDPARSLGSDAADPLARRRFGDGEQVRRELRRVAAAERARVALREILPPSPGGADVDVTAPSSRPSPP